MEPLAHDPGTDGDDSVNTPQGTPQVEEHELEDADELDDEDVEDEED